MQTFLVCTLVYQCILIIEKNIRVIGEGSTDGLVNTSITAETKCSVYITKSRKKICLGLHYNAANSFLQANGVKIYQFITMDSEIK